MYGILFHTSNFADGISVNICVFIACVLHHRKISWHIVARSAVGRKVNRYAQSENGSTLQTWHRPAAVQAADLTTELKKLSGLKMERGRCAVCNNVLLSCRQLSKKTVRLPFNCLKSS